jgi:pimeloyl-ACP methyl ester carboxylesterase
VPAMKQRDPESGVMETEGQRVRYRVRGEGPPLLMINGLAAPLEFWRPLEARLSDFQTITVDAPGAGRSSTPVGAFGLERFADVMADLLEHLDIDSASVLGLSLGGMIAQELAHRHPERAEKLVLCSTAYRRTYNARGAAILARRARSGYRRRRDQSRDERPGAASGARLSLLPRDLGGLPSGRGFVLQMRAAMSWSSRAWLDQLEMPVLVIAGDDDLLIPVSQARRIAKTVRCGRLVVVPSGGHLWVLKQPAAAAGMIRQFLLES